MYMLSKSKLKYIQSLGQKKFRQQEGLFIAEGPKLVNDLLEMNHCYRIRKDFTIIVTQSGNSSGKKNCY